MNYVRYKINGTHKVGRWKHTPGLLGIVNFANCNFFCTQFLPLFCSIIIISWIWAIVRLASLCL